MICFGHKKILTIALITILILLSACSSSSGESPDVPVAYDLLEPDGIQGSGRLVDDVTDPSTDEEFSETEDREEGQQASSSEEIADAWIKEHGIYKEATYVNISHNDINDVDIDAVIGRLPNLERLVMIDCGLDNDGYAAIQDRHPDIKIVWEIVLSHWTIRTDSVAFSTYKTTDEEFYMNKEQGTGNIKKRYPQGRVSLWRANGNKYKVKAIKNQNKKWDDARVVKDKDRSASSYRRIYV